MSKASLWTFDELRQQLRRFGIDYSERMLRYVLASLGVRKLDQVPNESTGKGRVALYHPLAAWVVASAYHSADGSSVRPDSPPLDVFRSMARSAWHGDATDERRLELLAYWLMITSPDYGMDLAKQWQLVSGDPSLLDLFPGGREAANAIFTDYRINQAQRASRGPRVLLSPIPYDPPTVDQDRVSFAESILSTLPDGWPVVPSLREAGWFGPAPEGGDASRDM